MRDEIAAAILFAFERTYQEHGCSFDPDTCYEAADEVIARLTSLFTGQECRTVKGPLIGPALFSLELEAREERSEAEGRGDA